MTGKDVAGKPADEIREMLAPLALDVTRGVKRIEYVIDLEQARPVTLLGRPGEAIELGTVVLEGIGMSSISVDTTILTNGLTVIAR